MNKFFLFLLTLAAIFPTIGSAGPVEAPLLKKQIKWTGTSWFGSPIIHDLGTGSAKLIGTFYSIYVWDEDFNEIAKISRSGRIYAPVVCADLEGDGIYEIVYGSTSGEVGAYEWRENTLKAKSGWPVSTCDAGQCPEVRGLAAGDLDGDGRIEVVATTTQTESDGAQVFVFSHDGTLYQPEGISWPAWPRYNNLTGTGNDADSNGPGNHGYGCYGLNVGIGNIDDDAEQEIVVTFDNHQINAFEHTGVSILASNWFTNCATAYYDNRLNWGQFIRYFDADVEENHYNLHLGNWPGPATEKWLQWTASPPSVYDIDGDGKKEVVCIPNVEMDIPYDTKHHAIMVLEGNYGDGSRSARRLSGWETLPSSGYPLNKTLSWYPPSNPPAPTIIDLDGDGAPEILYGAHDGYIYCTDANANQLWRRDVRHGRDLMYASEIMAADLNQDDIPELIFTTYGDPESVRPGEAHGYLMILDHEGVILHDLALDQQGTNGNGKGAPAAPTLGDLDGDGNLEIVIQTFGAGLFVYTVPGSAPNRLLWPTGRGNYLRDGRPWHTPATTACTDTDNDGDTDGLDLAALIHDYGKQGCGMAISCPGDVNGDHLVNDKDVISIADDFGKMK